MHNKQLGDDSQIRRTLMSLKRKRFHFGKDEEKYSQVHSSSSLNYSATETETETETILGTIGRSFGLFALYAIPLVAYTLFALRIISAENMFFDAHPMMVALISIFIAISIWLPLSPLKKNSERSAIFQIFYSNSSKILYILLGIVTYISFEYLPATSIHEPNEFVKISTFLFVFCSIALSIQVLKSLCGIIRLHRSKLTFKSNWFVFAGTLGAFIAYWFGSSVDNIGLNGNIANIILLITAFISIRSVWKVSWLVHLPKNEKWKAFWISSGNFIVSAVLFSMLSSSEKPQNAYHYVVPGLEFIAEAAAGITALIMFRFTSVLLLSLPTADFIDRKNNEVRSLSFLTKIMTQVYDMQQLLETVTRLTSDVCGASGAWIELESDNDVSNASFFEVVARYNITEDNLRLLYSSRAIQVIARQSAQMSVIDDLSQEEFFAEIYPQCKDFVRSLIAVPLFESDRRVGTIFAIHQQEFAFEANNLSLLQAFADNIILALENARLFQTSLEKEKLEREFSLAQDIQQRLLPKVLPDIADYSLGAYSSPAQEVGGDYYDFLKLSDGTNCLIIADVSGKGISAAFYMAELKGVVTALASETSTAKELVSKVNSTLSGQMSKQMFITMTALTIDPQHSKVTFVRAGHAPIYVARSSHVERFTPDGLGIGLAKPAIFESTLEEKTIEISAGDRILLITDGVNEAVNASNQEFGEDRIIGILTESMGESGEFVVGNIVRSVAEFSSGTAQRDDITVVALVSVKN